MLRKTCISEGYFFTRWQFLLRGNIGAVPASVAVPTGSLMLAQGKVGGNRPLLTLSKYKSDMNSHHF